MVASSVAPSVDAGVEILERGGNAVDAAVAMAFAAGVAHQFSSGVGGGGFVVGILADGQSFALDTREVAPASAHADMYLGADGQLDRNASRYGGQAVAVPGLVQGLEQVHARHGKLAWKAVLAPAIRMCEQGVEVGPHHRRILSYARKRLEPYPETVRIQYAEGELPDLGWKLVQPDLARTLRAIARDGSKALTQGPIAEAIVEASARHGGHLTLEDLAGYETVWREPVRGSYRGYEIVSMPPPSSGGVHLIQMLNTLEPYDLVALGVNSSAYIHLVAEAMKLAFADRAVHLGDPDFYPVPSDWLTSKTYGEQLAARLKTPPLWRRPPWAWGKPRILDVERAADPPPNDAGTTHISVMDRDGNAVALTQTVNTLFGSGITVPGTGIVLNNEMDDFSAAPGKKNLWGVSGSEANKITAGKRPLSSMTPTIVLADGKPWIVVGSPMGPLIITTVMQTLINVIDFEMDLQAAVATPRFHHQWRPDRLRLEPEHPADVLDALRAMGHPVEVADFRLGAAAAAQRDPESGTFYGAADPRRDSGAAGP
jgi:gamma-glutamyltranspeptidase/glutathione hydrolase